MKFTLKFNDLFELHDYQKYLLEQIDYYKKERERALNEWIREHTKKNEVNFDYYNDILSTFTDMYNATKPLENTLHRLDTAEMVYEHILRQRKVLGIK